MEGRKKKVIKTVIILIFVFLIVYFVLPVSVPLILAFLTAAIFEPIIRWGKNRLSIPRKYSVLIVFALFLSVIVLLLYMFVSRGIAQIISFAERIPHYTVVFMNQMEDWNNAILSAFEDLSLPVVKEIDKQLARMMEMGLEPLKDFDYLGLAASFATWLPVFLINVLVYLIALFLFMLEMPAILSGFFSHLKEDTASKIRYMTSRLAGVIGGFFKAQFLVSIIIFVVTLIGLFILAPEVAIIMSLIIWLIDFIPIIGSIVIVGPWAVIEFIQGDLYTGIGMSILAIVLLTIRRTVEPKVMGQYMGISPLAALISMFLGVQLLGIAGFILGPLLLIAYMVAKESGIIKMNFKL